MIDPLRETYWALPSASIGTSVLSQPWAVYLSLNCFLRMRCFVRCRQFVLIIRQFVRFREQVLTVPISG